MTTKKLGLYEEIFCSLSLQEKSSPNSKEEKIILNTIPVPTTSVADPDPVPF
jgi:hypothetical protein